MESLHYGEMLGGYYINSGFYWGSTTGIYCAILEGEGSRWMGMRSRAPPVADAARRSTRSGRKNRASEQREDFFGHRKAVGANAAAGYLWSASVRSTDLDFSPQKNLNPYPAQLSVKGVCQGGSLVPLDPVLLPFAGAKGSPCRIGILII